jgi:DNA-binding SARP family transcriptional activator
MLAFLGIRGPSSRAAVAGTLWPAVPEGRAHASLRTAIWRLNHCDPGLLTILGDRLALSAAVDVDLHALRSHTLRLLSPGPVRDCDVALSPLIGAELLPGWYEDWVLFERERLRQLWLHALESLSDLLIQRHRYAEALEAALEAVRSEPLRESAHRAVIAVHLAEDNVVEALRHYERFHQLIAAELQVEPSERLAAMVAPWVPAARRVRGEATADLMAVPAATSRCPVRTAVRPRAIQAASPGPAQATSHPSQRQLRYR